MQIIDFAAAPNPKKLRVFVGEKGLKIPFEQVDLISGGTRTPEFLAKNPLGGVPILQLDDGSYLTESLAIMQYLDELHPTPPLIGTTPLERARTHEIERIIDLGVLGAIAVIMQNSSPFFAGRFKQSADAAENGTTRLNNTLRVVDAHIGSKPFVAGTKPTIADCTLYAALDFANGFAQVPIDPKFQNVARWYEAFKQRPSVNV